MDSYDLIVIGTGTAAQVAASRVRKAGRSVAVIDHRPFGGTCALRGCDPKRMMVSGAEAIDLARRMRTRGVIGDLSIEWKDLIAFRRSFTDPVPKKREQDFAKQGIDAFHGLARFAGPDRIAVGDHTLRGRHVLIASGARPAPLAFPGAGHLTTSDAFMDLAELPGRIVMVGGGYIAAEFSHIAARAGARVTVLQRAVRMLPAFDAELVDWLMEKFAEIGVDVRTGNAVTAIEQCGDEYRVHVQTPQGEAIVNADLVVHAAGRVPDLTELNLSAANVAIADGRLELNDFLQSVSNPIVYAAGDAAAKGPPLTPVSSHDAKVAAANILEGNRHKPDYRGVPSVAFTLPPIAAVGLSESAARMQAPKLRVKSASVPNWYTARRVAESVYGYKTLVDEDSDRILGAHLVGPHADEVINLFALAIRNDLTIDDLKSTIFGYPTGASDIGYML
ncbi:MULTISPECIES: NAD(P)/FAD-dependent oxidoreductase [unclassified Bradyrhizobium]|uniref:dihydrolipoyl dehydrogenase family protein n=1 Tax=unclassified Bradyrhizobium TaxID=2631580 RepID=UPI00247910ED|nr:MULTISPECIES: NAD(P)/FAD-dependent oxidoreductase [unclassified Bradyrhizobium]WGR71330.1 NAD(P)/FAD-dependent oxidoreductase [Bradyrhizobium sp. ISRA426]WGR76165.1 NAD(P)/FAD-dependent oxidoreductase [Bradyrhizobium sp. ISRA430]WGR86570.1 NAD(P)/FAD-dependent oxidoreductase [Bradyrhizobium sp. ISRA432]